MFLLCKKTPMKNLPFLCIFLLIVLLTSCGSGQQASETKTVAYDSAALQDSLRETNNEAMEKMEMDSMMAADSVKKSNSSTPNFNSIFWRFRSADKNVVLRNLEFDNADQDVIMKTGIANIPVKDCVLVTGNITGPANKEWSMEIKIDDHPIRIPSAFKISGKLDAQGKCSIHVKCKAL
jgi:hypothetical protein